jgi:CheY-like chemotaxis protein
MSAEVLLVDDDRAALYALSEVLSDLPVRLTLVESGEDALRQVLKHEFAAILLDVRLPKMDGFEVAAAIRSLERSRETPIIFMSAHDDRRKQARAGAEDYLRKPLAPALVRSKLAALIERHRGDPARFPETTDLQRSPWTPR